MYDFAFGTLLLTETNFTDAVALKDLITIHDLEVAVGITSIESVSEISIIVDAAMALAREYPTFD